MKTKSKITFLLIVVCIVLIALNAVVFLAEDRQAPVISIPQTELTYSDGMDVNLLLDGVTASDNREGDVTDSLRVGEILPSADGSQVTVVYIAKDGSNNIAQASRVLTVEGFISADNSQGTVSDSSNEGQDAGDTPAEPTVTETPVPTETVTPEPTTTVEPTDANEAGRLENEAAIAALPAESPRLYLSQYAVTISAYSDFNALGYVSDVTDDVDSRDTMFTRISIDGAVDTQTPGTYDLYFYANDSSGNVSNRAHLVVTVE